MALFPGLPGWAGTRKVKPIWIWLNQETVSGSGISWAMCKSAPHSRQITTPAPHHSVFYRPDALPAAEPTASKHITPSLSVILVSQITLVSVLVLVYNYSLVLVFRRILVLVFTFEGILVSVSGLFFVHDIKFLPQCQLLRNHCTIQKIARAQYGNVSQSTMKITSAATLVQYFRLRHQHGNKSRTAWFIFRNTRRSSVVAMRFRFPVVRSPHMRNTRSAYASEAGAWIKSKASRLNHSYLAWRAPAVRNQPKCCSGRMWPRSQTVKYWRTLGVGSSWSVKQKRQLISHVFVSFRRRFLFLF